MKFEFYYHVRATQKLVLLHALFLYFDHREGVVQIACGKNSPDKCIFSNPPRNPVNYLAKLYMNLSDYLKSEFSCQFLLLLSLLFLELTNNKNIKLSFKTISFVLQSSCIDFMLVVLASTYLLFL